MAEPIKFKKLPNGDIIKGFELESVGTFISLEGTTYALGTDGSIDADSATYFDEIEPDGDWMTTLSDDDRKIVEAMMQNWLNGKTPYGSVQGGR